MAGTQFAVLAGPANVYIDVNGTDVLMGPTNGDIGIKLAQETFTTTTDQQGDVDEFVIKTNVSFECPFTDLTMEQLAKIIPGCSMTSGATKILYVKNAAGTSLPKYKVTLKPIQGETELGKGYWQIIQEATIVPNFDTKHGPKQQKIYSVSIKAHATDEDLVFQFGSSS